MAVLLWCSILFLTAFVLHVVLWQVVEPKSPLKTLLVIFFGVFFLGLVLLDAKRHALDALGIPRLSGALNYWHALVFYVPVALTYINLYTALQVDSPTLSLVYEMYRTGQAGMSGEDIEAFLASRNFASDRLQALIENGTVVERDGRYVVRRGRHLLFRTVLFFRRLYAGRAEG